MALHYIFLFLFGVPILVGVTRFFLDPGAEMVMHDMVQATADYGEKGIKLVLFFMLPMMILWLGLMNIAEKAGAIKFISWFVNPFFNKLFPDLPKDHPARGSIVMNYAANMLGLDNAATPLGLRAMNQLQEANPQKDTASNAQIMFLVLNTSGLSILPVGVFTLRMTAHANDVTGVFVPVLIATYCATLVALLIVSLYQKIKLYDPIILAYVFGSATIVAAIMWYFASLSAKSAQAQAGYIGDFLYLAFILFFLVFGMIKKVNVFDKFIDGAKEAFQVGVMIFPYIVGFLVAIGIFVASGTMNYIVDGLGFVLAKMGVDNQFVEAVPVALMKPINGKAAQAMVLEVFEHCKACAGTVGCNCADTFAGKLASTVQGTTDTTFYILAVYFGSVGIKKIRYAAWAGLLADLGGIIAAIIVSYIFYK